MSPLVPPDPKPSDGEPHQNITEFSDIYAELSKEFYFYSTITILGKRVGFQFPKKGV